MTATTATQVLSTRQYIEDTGVIVGPDVKKAMAHSMAAELEWRMATGDYPNWPYVTVEGSRVSEFHYLSTPWGVELRKHDSDRKKYSVWINGEMVAKTAHSMDKAKHCAMYKLLAMAHGPGHVAPITEPTPVTPVTPVITEPTPPAPAMAPTAPNSEQVLKDLGQVLGVGGAVENRLAEMQRRIDDLQQAINSGVKSNDITITDIDKATTTTIEGVHKEFKRVLFWLSIGKNVLIVGPSGSGKTSTWKDLCTALGREGEVMGPASLKYDYLGFNDANGNYIPTPLYKAMTGGKLLLIDEYDASNPNACVPLHSALDNGFIDTPNGQVIAEKGFVVLASGNTNGDGATAQYNGRNQQDGATKQRFAVLEFGYDEEMEMRLALAKWAGAGPWVKRVQAYRHAAQRLNSLHIISPRQSIEGAVAFGAMEAMTGHGMDADKVESDILWKLLDQGQIDKIKENAKEEIEAI